MSRQSGYTFGIRPSEGTPIVRSSFGPCAYVFKSGCGSRCSGSWAVQQEQASTYVQVFENGSDLRSALVHLGNAVEVIILEQANDVSPLNLAAALHKDEPRRDIYMLRNDVTGRFASSARAAGARGVIDSAQARELLCPQVEQGQQAEQSLNTRHSLGTGHNLSTGHSMLALQSQQADESLQADATAIQLPGAIPSQEASSEAECSQTADEHDAECWSRQGDAETPPISVPFDPRYDDPALCLPWNFPHASFPAKTRPAAAEGNQLLQEQQDFAASHLCAVPEPCLPLGGGADPEPCLRQSQDDGLGGATEPKDFAASHLCAGSEPCLPLGGGADPEPCLRQSQDDGLGFVLEVDDEVFTWDELEVFAGAPAGGFSGGLQDLICPEGAGMAISFFSGRGGTGKSTLALLSAMLLADRGFKVALVDLDTQFGDISYLAGHEEDGWIERLSLSAAIGTACSLPAKSASGICLVEAPEAPEQAEGLLCELPGFLARLKQGFDHVVVNTSAFWTETAAYIARSSDRLCFVMDQRATSVRGCRQAAEICVRLEIPTSRFAYLLNRCSKRAPISDLDASLALDGAEVVRIADGGQVVDELLSLGCPNELLVSMPEMESSIEAMLVSIGALSAAQENKQRQHEGWRSMLPGAKRRR